MQEISSQMVIAVWRKSVSRWPKLYAGSQYQDGQNSMQEVSIQMAKIMQEVSIQMAKTMQEVSIQMAKTMQEVSIQMAKAVCRKSVSRWPKLYAGSQYPDGQSCSAGS